MLTALGLWLLGVELALTLGLIAALLTFIPNLGRGLVHKRHGCEAHRQAQDAAEACMTA